MTTTDSSMRVRATWRDWGALATLMLPVLLVSIDNTVLHFALPAIARDVRPSAQAQLWIIDAYPLVLAGLLVAMGALGDRFGRRRVLLIGSAGFGLVSIAAAFAPTAELLIAARVALGFFGAMLMPSTLSLIRSTFVDRNERRVAIAVWATGFSIGSAIGPAVGGVLLAHFAWGSVFLIAVPILAPLVVLGPWLIRESRDPRAMRVDIAGIALSMLALAPLAAAIKHIAAEGPDAFAAGLLVVAGVATWGFVRRMRRAEHPLIDLELLAHRPFAGAVIVNLVSVIALVGFLFFLTQHLQLVEGLSTLDAAIRLAPGILAMIVTGLGSVWLVRHMRAVHVVVGALAASLLAYTWVAVLGAGIEPWQITAAFALLGAGIGAAETMSNDLIIAAAPADKAGAAAGVSETAYEFGAVLGTSVLGGVLTAVYRDALTLPAGVGAAERETASETLAGAIDVGDDLGGALGAAVQEAARSAFDAGVTMTAGVGAALMLVAIAVAWVTLRRA